MAYTAKSIVLFSIGARPVVSGNQSGYANNFWHYTTPDAHAAVLAANYFDAAAGILKKGDIIFCTVADAGTPQARIYMVTARTATAVTIVQQIFTA